MATLSPARQPIIIRPCRCLRHPSCCWAAAWQTVAWFSGDLVALLSVFIVQRLIEVLAEGFPTFRCLRLVAELLAALRVTQLGTRAYSIFRTSA